MSKQTAAYFLYAMGFLGLGFAIFRMQVRLRKLKQEMEFTRFKAKVEQRSKQAEPGLGSKPSKGQGGN